MAATKKTKLPLSREEIIGDYRLAYRSRQASAIGRREVLTGKAKFGIFGDGKELVQIVIGRYFQKGDWRSGYYRDQTWMFKLGVLNLEEYFASLYGITDPKLEPLTGGRSMNNMFGTRLLDDNGMFLSQTDRYNSYSDAAPTAIQLPRSVGLAYSSVLYRNNKALKEMKEFSDNGNEVTWVTIGNASTSQGVFWESVNAIGVLHAPAIISIYDDGYGISVPNQFQMVKENIGAVLQGFQRDPCPAEMCDRGYDIYSVKGWDYVGLLGTYKQAAENARKYHIPALVHVTELTQQFGHSTSGSHERYKSKKRLQWEKDFDNIPRLKAWMIENGVAKESEFAKWEEEDTLEVETARKKMYAYYRKPIDDARKEAVGLLTKFAAVTEKKEEVTELANNLKAVPTPNLMDTVGAIHDALAATLGEDSPERTAARDLKNKIDKDRCDYYNSELLSYSKESPFKVRVVKPKYSDKSPIVDGYQVMNAAFDAILSRDKRVVAFGEDVGQLGDVNQGFHGMQEKHGMLRVMDKGIREATILGEAIGMALRGLKPIAEIQYLDYLMYALQLMADDVSTARWRTAGGAKLPLIIRTRGHRLEGMFHSGSPMGGIIHLVRGMHVLVPRNMVQAAGFYNTMIQSDDPALIVEVLNGYRVKERLPDNIGEMTVPIGVPEILRKGKDVTLVTYGPLANYSVTSAEKLAKIGIDTEVIDVQSLLPFDINGMIVESLKKTNRVVFVDEDMPGATTAYMMQQVLEVQGGYQWLDAAPRTLPAANHRPAYTTDGNYYSKPNIDSVFDAVYNLMREGNPAKFPEL